MKKIELFLKQALEKKFDILTWAVIFIAAIFSRSFVEQFLAITSPMSFAEMTVNFLQNFYFFLLTILLLWLFLSYFLAVRPQQLTYLFTFSVGLILAPSLIDMLQNHGQIYWSFYLLSDPKLLFFQYVTIFGHLPSGIVYFGTRIVFVFVVILTAGFVWLVTKKIWKAAVGLVVAYSIMFLMGAFPTLFYYLYVFVFGPGKISEIHSFTIAGFFGAPEKIWGVVFSSFGFTLAYKLDYIYFLCLLLLAAGLFFRASREKFWAVAKDLRWPQIVFHAGLFFIGMGLALSHYPNNFNLDIFSIFAILVLLAAVILSWEASVVVNDIYDLEVDRISNPGRPLPSGAFSRSDYAQFGWLCFLLAVLGGLTIGPIFAVLFVIYQILAWVYSAPPFRLKKFPVVATFMSAVALLMVLFVGYALVADGQTIHTLPGAVIFLLLISYTISLPIKDFKDLAGDRANGIWTWPVLLGEKKARLLVAVGLFVSYILSVFFLGQLRLFWWALFFGTATYLVVNSEKTKPRQLFWRVLLLVAIYGVILVKIVFL